MNDGPYSIQALAALVGKPPDAIAPTEWMGSIVDHLMESDADPAEVLKSLRAASKSLPELAAALKTFSDNSQKSVAEFQTTIRLIIDKIGPRPRLDQGATKEAVDDWDQAIGRLLSQSKQADQDHRNKMFELGKRALAVVGIVVTGLLIMAGGKKKS